jgi:hypothetical protein
MHGVAVSASMGVMPPTGNVNPQLTWRVPENVQALARARAAQLRLQPGAYIAKLIIDDSPELAHLFVETDEHSDEHENEREATEDALA